MVKTKYALFQYHLTQLYINFCSDELYIKRTRVAQWVRSLDLTIHTSLSPIRRVLAPGFVNYTKGWTLLAAACDKAYQMLSDGRWFSPGTPASSTTKTGRHDIAEILLKVALNTKRNTSIKNQTNKKQVLNANFPRLTAYSILMILFDKR